MIRTRITKPIFLLACLFSAAASLAQDTTKRHEFSVQQCVDYARKNNVQVKNALLDIKIQQQTNRTITARALPSVSASAAFTDYIDIPTSLIPGEIFGQPPGTYIPVQFGTKYTASGGVTLNQILFDGQVFVGLQARETSILYQQKTAEVTEEQIKANIYKVYYQLVASKTQISLLDANIARLEKLKSDANIMFQNGFAERLDIDKADVQLSNLKTEKLKALNRISNGYLGLKTLMGMPVKETLVLTDSISDSQIKKDMLRDSVNYNDRKEYQNLMLVKKLNEYNIKSKKLSYYPTLSLQGNYSKQAQRNKFDFFDKGGDWFTTSFIGLNLSIPIFSGFSKDAEVTKARIELQQVQNNIDDLKINIDNDAEQARLNFISAVETMDYQKKNMQLAENVYNQTKKKFEVGTGSNTEINAADTDLKAAQTNYINAMYDAIIAKIDYLKAIGQLP